MQEQAAHIEAAPQQACSARQPSQQPSAQPGSSTHQGGSELPPHNFHNPAEAAAASGPALGADAADAALGPGDVQPLRSIIIGREQALHELKPEGLKGNSQGQGAPSDEVWSLGVHCSSLDCWCCESMHLGQAVGSALRVGQVSTGPERGLCCFPA